MIKLSSGAQREVENVKFSRYACYLIIQNAVPAKEMVALGQSYFMAQTRLQEFRPMDDYNSATDKWGYMGLHGGLDAKGIHRRKGLKMTDPADSRPHRQHRAAANLPLLHTNSGKTKTRK